MSFYKSRKLALAAVGAIAIGCGSLAGFGTVASAGENAHDERVRVDAPNTSVRVDQETGKVGVRAPYTAVKVDPDKGRVRVRAPYVNLDIRW